MTRDEIQKVRDAIILARHGRDQERQAEALNILDAALARDDAKPFGWMYTAAGIPGAFSRNLPKSIREQSFNGKPQWTPLYTHPPEDAKDAARYRFIRDHENNNRGVPFIATFISAVSQWTGDRADAIIDAAMKEQSHD